MGGRCGIGIFAVLALLPTMSMADERSATSSDFMYQLTLEPTGRGDENGDATDRLVLTNTKTGARRVLLVARYNQDHTKNLSNLDTPMFSLNGGFAYINSGDPSPYRSAVHQINLKTGEIRYVTTGWALSLLRTGPYRGMLLVQKHLIKDSKHGGTYNPVFVIRPDGHRELMVPNSDTREQDAVEPWLKAKGWTSK
jgi:hypothetical protein